MRKILDLYINSSLHVALAVASFSLVTCIRFQHLPHWELLLFVLFGSITGYNFVKYAGLAKLHHLSLTRNLRFIQFFSLCCFLAAAYFLFQQPREVIVLSAILGCFTLLYAVPFWKGKANLRSINGTKIFVIALVWAGTTVLLPLFPLGAMDSMIVFSEFLQRFLLVLVLMFPFEIRDLKFDKLQLGTIPQRIGTGRTKNLGYVLLLLILLLEFLRPDFKVIFFLPLLFTVLISGMFLYRTRKEQSPYFASFWVEAIPIMWLLISLLLRNLF
ncbi:hypothetical protein [Zunongwangia sp. H14]|uniref:hypothetical protein n=1 Tax=Zunongwangia sp. H14 TaxID=3240792 RepID=UPI00356513A3